MTDGESKWDIHKHPDKCTLELAERAMEMSLKEFLEAQELTDGRQVELKALFIALETSAMLDVTKLIKTLDDLHEKIDTNAKDTSESVFDVSIDICRIAGKLMALSSNYLYLVGANLASEGLDPCVITKEERTDDEETSKHEGKYINLMGDGNSLSDTIAEALVPLNPSTKLGKPN